MKNGIYLLIILLVSCSAKKTIIGNYEATGKDFQYNLTLNKDSSFFLSEKSFESNPICKGKWHYATKDTLLLSCDSTNNPVEMISSGYMSVRKRKIVIINNNRLKFERVILHKTNKQTISE